MGSSFGLIVAKILRGEEDRIRPCVGENYCLDRIYQGGMALCLHNPATLRNFVLNEPRGGVLRQVNLLVPPKHPAAQAAFLGRSPDTATPEDLRAYKLHSMRRPRPIDFSGSTTLTERRVSF